jgi:catechol 2,3-dioxygenase-like lactoylglutathione lyase family enzyme
VIDHVKLFVADAAASRAFYEASLEPLGYRVMLEPAPGVVGMGAERPDFWLAPADGTITHCHLCFRADSELDVQRFHAAALAAGATDNGQPGPRPHYHQNYYGAFALDPDGNNVEAVYHGAMQP